MAITTTMCNSYKLECLTGIHTDTDTYKIALYTNAASLDANTTTYSATNEVANGNGYTTGGATLSGFTASLDGTKAIIDFNDVSWAASTITARGAMIYNSSKANRAVAVFDFGADISSTASNFNITMPAPAAATAVIRIA